MPLILEMRAGWLWLWAAELDAAERSQFHFCECEVSELALTHARSMTGTLRRGYTEGADGAEGYDASLRVDVGSAVLMTRLVALN